MKLPRMRRFRLYETLALALSLVTTTDTLAAQRVPVDLSRAVSDLTTARRNGQVWLWFMSSTQWVRP